MRIITLTKQPTNPSSGGAPGSQGAGAPEVTSEMIEAGIGAIQSLEYEFWESRTPEDLAQLVTAIYLAMSEHRCSKPS